MRAALLVFFCALTLSASAQFWKKKKAPAAAETMRFDVPVSAEADTALSWLKESVIAEVAVAAAPLPTKTQFKLVEEDVMKEVKHHMRYREFVQASYSFTDLATLYLLQNRFSEAKWYLLQSSEISREQKNNKLTITNLIMLAKIKAAIGELPMAKIDLQEAHDLANANSFSEELATVDKALQNLATTSNHAKAELRYADAVEAKKTAK